MKNKFPIFTLFLAAFPLTLLLLVGCSSLQKPPSDTEQKFFTVQTNYTPVVAAVTNLVVSVDPATSQLITNRVVSSVTNLNPQYVFLPNTNAQDTSATAGALASLISPGGGAIVGSVIAGIFGIWGVLRSRRSNQTAAALAQIIETGEQVLLSLPNGAAISAQYKAWMIKHQAETNTLAEASKLVANIVDTDDARQAAQKIAELVAKTSKV